MTIAFESPDQPGVDPALHPWRHDKRRCRSLIERWLAGVLRAHPGLKVHFNGNQLAASQPPLA